METGSGEPLPNKIGALRNCAFLNVCERVATSKMYVPWVLKANLKRSIKHNFGRGFYALFAINILRVIVNNPFLL
jgi:hypothetical protein